MDYLTVLLVSVVVLAIAMLGLALNIIFKKDGKFPETEIGHNKAMRDRGISCVKCDERGECKFDDEISEISLTEK